MEQMVIIHQDHILISELLTNYRKYLQQREYSIHTIAKYMHDIHEFLKFLDNREMNKDIILDWKKYLIKKYAPSTVNSMLVAINIFLEWMKLSQYKVKLLKLQRELFCKPEKELTYIEYTRLIRAAEHRQNDRLAMMIQTICSTGIRVSELHCITVESLKIRRATVYCKGKTRTVFLPKELCHILQYYCQKHHIKSGIIFCTKNGKILDRSNIWRDMKNLCKSAGVNESKVFPHNLRHLFARMYYKLEKDLSKLADLLGHTNISTTRIYTMESGEKHAQQLDRLGLILPIHKKQHNIDYVVKEFNQI